MIEVEWDSLTHREQAQLRRARLLARQAQRATERDVFRFELASLAPDIRLVHVVTRIHQVDGQNTYQRQMVVATGGRTYRGTGYGTSPHEASMDALLDIRDNRLPPAE